MNLTFTKVRTELLNIAVPAPYPGPGDAIPHSTLNSGGNRSQGLLRCSLIRMRGMVMERRKVSTSYVCLLPPSAFSVQLRRPWMPLRGDLALRNLAAGALYKLPKGGSLAVNRPRGIPSGHQRNEIILRTKPNVRMGLSNYSRQNPGTNQALGFPDCILGRGKQQTRIERTWT